MKKMNLSFILSIFVAFESGCGYFCDVEVCSYEIASGESWLPDTVNQAIEFWATKNVFLEHVEDGGEIQIDVDDLSLDGPAGQYQIYTAKIVLNNEYVKINYEHNNQAALELRRKCILSHEMGHSFGMWHNNSYIGLMSTTNTISPEGECAWSDEDQAELDRILGLR